jgi:hypothetical protein
MNKKSFFKVEVVGVSIQFHSIELHHRQPLDMHLLVLKFSLGNGINGLVIL